MRYLWVEDFNDEGNADNSDELREHLIDFFDLEEDKLIIKNDLLSAITFLEESDNLSLIDAILLDIRFPEGRDSNIFNRFFKGIVTEEFYKNNINDASGILLYLLLIFRYHISQKKIAFISANIESDSKASKIISEMKELIIKSKHEQLIESDKKEYITNERTLGTKILHIEKKNKTWDTFISKDDNVQNIDRDKLINCLDGILESINKGLSIDSKNDNGAKDNIPNVSLMQYLYVKDKFEEIGFAMPSAFEKKGQGEKRNRRYLFLQWEEDLYNNEYIAIRSNVLGLLNILDNEISKNYNQEIVSRYLDILSCRKDELKCYDSNYFLSYIRDIKRLFDFCKDIESVSKCSLFLKEISSVWEASTKPLYKECSETGRVIKNDNGCKINENGGWYNHQDNLYYTVHATMKLVRNWIGHQGIRNLNFYDVGFLMIINLRGLFDISKLSDEGQLKYSEFEKKLMDLINFGSISIDIRSELKDSFDYFCRLNMKTNPGKNFNSTKIFDRISGLGHEKSQIRLNVCMDEIYMLFYHSICKDDFGDYKDLVHAIEYRTWKDWRERYNKRFGEIYSI